VEISYNNRIRQAFADVWNYFEAHKSVRTDSDWQRATEALKQYSDPLTQGLLVPIVFELEREYKINLKRSK